ncbi:MAG TPA: hypothetical protein VNX25_04685 [Verrucomicrobiae bacterium]|nr:hypothetical protein [Verrucomicrobiae bacterium]
MKKLAAAAALVLASAPSAFVAAADLRCSEPGSVFLLACSERMQPAGSFDCTTVQENFAREDGTIVQDDSKLWCMALAELETLISGGSEGGGE